MRLSCNLLKILSVQHGRSLNGPWSKQDIIVETTDDYPKKVCISIWNGRIDISKLEVGKQYNFHCNIESMEYKGKWYTDVTLWKLEEAYLSDDDDSKSITAEQSLDRPANIIETQIGLNAPSELKKLFLKYVDEAEAWDSIDRLNDEQKAIFKKNMTELSSNGKFKSDRKLRISSSERQEITSILPSFENSANMEEASESIKNSEIDFNSSANNKGEGIEDHTRFYSIKGETIETNNQGSINESDIELQTNGTIKPHGKLKDEFIQNCKKYGSTRKLGGLEDTSEPDIKP